MVTGVPQVFTNTVMVTGVLSVFATNTGNGDWCATSVHQHRLNGYLQSLNTTLNYIQAHYLAATRFHYLHTHKPSTEPSLSRDGSCDSLLAHNPGGLLLFSSWDCHWFSFTTVTTPATTGATFRSSSSAGTTGTSGGPWGLMHGTEPVAAQVPVEANLPPVALVMVYSVGDELVCSQNLQAKASIACLACDATAAKSYLALLHIAKNLSSFSILSLMLCAMKNKLNQLA
uniref:Uncharacterized protein n=1 Tax=Timema tahoe TaxID=61484 RepID=A0A7R9NZ22_9NEOP|nr:unnamed protein product [Timema tahoe]